MFDTNGGLIGLFWCSMASTLLKVGRRLLLIMRGVQRQLGLLNAEFC